MARPPYLARAYLTLSRTPPRARREPTYSDSVDIYDSQNPKEDNTAAPTGGGNAFTVTWLTTGTPTPIG